MRLINVYGSRVYYVAYKIGDTWQNPDFPLHGNKGYIEHGKDKTFNAGEDKAHIIIYAKEATATGGEKRLVSGNVKNTEAAYISKAGVGDLPPEVKELLDLAERKVLPPPPPNSDDEPRNYSIVTNDKYGSGDAPRDRKTVAPPDKISLSDTTAAIQFYADSCYRLAALATLERGSRPLLDPSGDDTALGNVLLTTFPADSPPQERPPLIEFSALKRLDEADAAQPAADILNSAGWLHHEAAKLVEPIMQNETAPAALREKLANIEGSTATEFEQELGHRLAPTGRFQTSYRWLLNNRKGRLQALPEFRTGAILNLTFQRIAALTDKDVKEIESERLDVMIEDAKAARDKLIESKADYNDAVTKDLNDLAMNNTPLEARIRKGLAAKYLADPDATDATFFDTASTQFNGLIERLEEQKKGSAKERLRLAPRRVSQSV